MRRLTTALVSTAAFALAAGYGLSAEAGPPADWSDVPEQTIMLFYPGQSTYDWLRDPEHGEGKGAKMLKKGKACLDCHEDDEEEMGDTTVTGEIIEPDPIDGKNGSVELTVQAAYDDQNIYFRFQWEAQEDGAGPEPADDRLAIMLDDGGVDRFAEEGCWLTCHTGMPDTQNEAPADAVKAHPLLGKFAKDGKVHKYLPASRTDEMASWDKTKSAEEIAKIKAAGGFVDLIQWHSPRDNPGGKAVDDIVLEYRMADEGGSAGDAKVVSATLEDGVWTVVLSRALDTGNADDKALKEGEEYTVGFAIHDNNVHGRRHFTAFPRTLGIGVDADITAAKVE